MKQSVKYGWLVVILCTALFAGGCATYYRVKDPQSGKAYYTQKVDDVQGGAVKMKDARTGSIITLQSSEVKEISEEEFKAGLAAPVSSPASPPAAVAAPEAAPSAAPAPTPGPA